MRQPRSKSLKAGGPTDAPRPSFKSWMCDGCLVTPQVVVRTRLPDIRHFRASILAGGARSGCGPKPSSLLLVPPGWGGNERGKRASSSPSGMLSPGFPPRAGLIFGLRVVKGVRSRTPKRAFPSLGRKGSRLPTSEENGAGGLPAAGTDLILFESQHEQLQKLYTGARTTSHPTNPT